MTGTPTDPQDARDVARACEAILERHARSFALASLFLTRQMRKNAAICYAFCRIVDDAVDEVDDPREARAGLARIEEMLDGREPCSPIVSAYVALMRQSGVGLLPARELIEGARSDLETVRFRNDEDLLQYCYRVAGTVGLMMCGVLGVRDADARRHAIHLGMAMQMTNICRDVLEDAARARIYLPEERLLSEGVDPSELMLVGRGNAPDEATRTGVARVVRDLLEWAESYYDSGASGFRFIPTRARLAIVIARSLYREIGRTLLRRGGDSLSGRIAVSLARKMALTVQSVGNWIMGVVVKPSAPLSPETLHLLSK